MSELLTTREAAIHCGLSVTSVRSAVKRGVLAPDGEHLYSRETLDAWRGGARAYAPKATPPGLLSFAQAGARLKIRYETVAVWVKKGWLEKSGRAWITVASVEARLAEQEAGRGLLCAKDLAQALRVHSSAIQRAVAEGKLKPAGVARSLDRNYPSPGYRLEDGQHWKAQRVRGDVPRKRVLLPDRVVQEKVAHLLSLERVIRPGTFPRPTCRCPYPGCGGSVVSGEIEVGLWEHVCVLCAREVG